MEFTFYFFRFVKKKTYLKYDFINAKFVKIKIIVIIKVGMVIN